MFLVTLLSAPRSFSLIVNSISRVFVSSPNTIGRYAFASIFSITELSVEKRISRKYVTLLRGGGGSAEGFDGFFSVAPSLVAASFNRTTALP